MSEEMLHYLLRETATAIQIMARDETLLQVIDVGKDRATGTEYSMILMIVPKLEVERLAATLGTHIVASKPLENNIQ